MDPIANVDFVRGDMLDPATIARVVSYVRSQVPTTSSTSTTATKSSGLDETNSSASASSKTTAASSSAEIGSDQPQTETTTSEEESEKASSSPSSASEGTTTSTSSRPTFSNDPNRVADVVLSDMAHSFTGNKTADSARVFAPAPISSPRCAFDFQNLCESAMAVVHQILRGGGAFVVKFFQGEGDAELRSSLRQSFEKVSYEKPKSSRKDSAEGYLVCLGYRVPEKKA
ncbi:hypothetical protein HK102_003640 [Quaeritorhiza haematococci]|nr:hypothetical protein HK102_003640 [Quaeritorhiza haematococci]